MPVAHPPYRSAALPTRPPKRHELIREQLTYDHGRIPWLVAEASAGLDEVLAHKRTKLFAVARHVRASKSKTSHVRNVDAAT